MLVGYVRTSSVGCGEDFEAQKTAMTRLGCDEVFVEQASATGERGELDRALNFVCRGDTLVVTKLDRLARSTQHLMKIIDGLEEKEVALRILDFGGAEVDTKFASGRLVLGTITAMAQFEREMMLERQREGIQRAKEEGKYGGRRPVPDEQVKQIHALKEKGLKPPEIANKLSLGRSTVYRLLKVA